jgi:ABC-type branched-subunit amino acid transport system ATPase component
MLQISDIHMHFGGIRAVDGVSLTLAPGKITGLIGPNGAGKTTLFNVIAGLHKPTSGTVRLDGEDITSGCLTCGSGQIKSALKKRRLLPALMTLLNFCKSRLSPMNWLAIYLVAKKSCWNWAAR